MIKTEREYAQALFSLAIEEGELEEHLESIGEVKKALGDNPDYIEFLNSPAIALSEKLQALDEAFEGRIVENVLNFLKVICENGKARTVIGCIDEFLLLAMSFSDKTAATIYSAVALNDEQKNGICKKLENLTNKGIDPIFIIDPSLIGGLKIEVDGKTIDGSIKHRLGEIKDVMNS